MYMYPHLQRNFAKKSYYVHIPTFVIIYSTCFLLFCIRPTENGFLYVRCWGNRLADSPGNQGAYNLNRSDGLGAEEGILTIYKQSEQSNVSILWFLERAGLMWESIS